MTIVDGLMRMVAEIENLAALAADSSNSDEEQEEYVSDLGSMRAALKADLNRLLKMPIRLEESGLAIHLGEHGLEGVNHEPKS